MIQNSDLKYQTLENLLDYVIGGDWGKDPSHEEEGYELAYCIRASEMRNWKEEKGRTAALRKIKIQNIKKRQLKEGDLILEISGGGPEQPVGRTVLIDKSVLKWEPEIPKICTNFFRLIRPNNSVDSTYLNYYLSFFHSSGKVVAFQAGSNNLRNLKFNDYINIDVPLPPLPIQRAIVAKLETLFSELDKGIEQLKTARQQLRTYRQAVLKAAFEGRLTGEQVKERELPEGWRWATIEQVSDVGTGATPLRSNPAFYNGTINWVTSGELNEQYVRTATELITEKAIKETNCRVFSKGTLLVAMYGEGKTRGKCSELAIEAATNQAIAAIYFTNHDESIKHYLKYFLLKNYDDIRRKSSGGVQPNLNLGIIKKLQFPLAPKIKQAKIIAEIESRISVADKMDESIAQGLQQAEALRQSILKRAFEGELLK